MKTNEATFDCSDFRYAPESGFILRISNLKRAGTQPDSTCKYRRVCRGGNRVLEHRLAWRLMTGKWPTNEIDHRNGDKTDNRWVNLREATAAQNHQNVRDVSTHRGAYWDKTNKRYVVSVQADGKRFKEYASSHFSAVVASRLVRRVLHGEFSHEARQDAQLLQHDQLSHSRAVADLYDDGGAQ